MYSKNKTLNTLLVIIIVLFFSSCKTQVRLTGKIANLSAKDSIVKLRAKGFDKSIKIDSDGHFSDGFEITESGIYNFHIKGNRIPLFLDKGYKLNIETDAKNISILNFDGKGKETNNFLVASNKEYKALSRNYNKLYQLDTLSLNKEIASIKDRLIILYADKKVDKDIAKKIENQFEKVFVKLKDKTKRTSKRNTRQGGLKAGDIAPQFHNLENYNGGTTSMEDLKGKYIYIDVWATWCGPCRAQIPALKVLEEEYRDKNIEFVSISSDRPKSYDRWRRMIEREEMKGIQLYMGNDKSFMRDFGIRGIPRFIFIDPEGKIVRSSAPRPSQTKQVKKMFDAAGL